MRVVCLYGAGNVASSPAVVATVCNWQPESDVEFRLFDANEERLDLLDRFARTCLDRTSLGHMVKATSDLAEASAEVTDAILALHDDCARRMVGVPIEPQAVEEEPLGFSYLDLVRGDPNKPTPPHKLSLAARTLISQPSVETGTESQVVQEAAGLILESLPPKARLLTVAQQRVVPNREHTFLNWPRPIDADQLGRVPHQIHRWILGEPSLGDLLLEASDSPLREWLDLD
ncbi:MAG: hypothetical protein KIT11_02320 [Fimbriimonadaceae bacterium]|nr:hypothetical protein [Fimbriimonadaceae bacterium]QYK54796.1 MAG: hypothetical protein KF733_07215 [Fimbriimonadaceae bacterium]